MAPEKTTGNRLLDSYDVFLFDADGVLWLGDQVIPGAVDAINKLIDLGKQVLVITNNSTKTSDQFAQKISKLGFKKLSASKVISPAMVVSEYLTLDPRSKELPVYLIGTKNLESMINAAGIKTFGTGADNLDSDVNGFVESIDLSRKVFAVVTSYDPHFNYVKLTKAVNYIKDPDVQFIATNEDKTFPTSVPGMIVPGAGSSSLSVRAISGRTPVVMGKPHSSMFEYISRNFNINPNRTLMVGDRCDTDIWFGNSNNLDTLLVLTGVHDLAYVGSIENDKDLVPKYYADSINVFLE
ncbi:unnamed protein product [Bursaphelenchus xylophilus]|uniref:(pine wood nematode) hypothetical protein n=1 Tax=Bursaphelenchus xylophilus TaxID=6326 RepID=A0A1I7RH25_BURXY|nr:unnamed protein product [Bursaphelenchus xylophilus]CAG9116000.1 unnamed protein product [Bursaphelenchus xylophilus]